VIAAGSPRTEPEAAGELERSAEELAERMARPEASVDDELFARLRRSLDDEQLVELATWIALQNLYSSFNVALGID
jgi:alkylhydroperoxidase family enzyme